MNFGYKKVSNILLYDICQVGELLKTDNVFKWTALLSFMIRYCKCTATVEMGHITETE